ncbi:P-loop containing nucleoside triphosphate hydrolase protein [Radiomyces spectabilis]|uniref:P-loop containing nucleoside triphosphate hydrolase protein n=1 Tax=Radiomyces spectabilis TaxID=64574 RepID=UPI00221F4C32|nr:P-loop containing nucleoside triphosphate hydrolase protein [Radiomyces spectabilis]KAI8393851.1 P-loop containing nucleoside triphosphate hydrolase protein [Radiomyces spectabilis]
MLRIFTGRSRGFSPKYCHHRVYTRSAFESLGFSSKICERLEQHFGITHPTDAQSRFIPVIQSGHDVLLRDRTGTGKSFGLALALASQIPTAKVPTTPRSLYVVPNQELSLQISHWIEQLSPCPTAVTNLSSSVNASRSAHTVVTTPGKALELVEQGHLTVDHLERIILDEADQALRLPKRFATIRQHHRRSEHPKPSQILIDRILANLSARPQMIIASATLNRPLRHWLRQRGWIQNPVFVDLNSGVSPVGHSSVTHHCLLLSNDEIRNIQPSKDTETDVSEDQHSVTGNTDITHDDERVLESIAILQDLETVHNGILFLNTGASVSDMKRNLAKFNVDARDIREFRPGVSHGTNPLWLATEFTARGLDLPDVSHVFILGRPSSYASYVHMAGRTGRLGIQGFKHGKIISLIPDAGKAELAMFTMYKLLNIPVKKYEHVQ